MLCHPRGGSMERPSGVYHELVVRAVFGSRVPTESLRTVGMCPVANGGRASAITPLHPRYSSSVRDRLLSSQSQTRFQCDGARTYRAAVETRRRMAPSAV